MSTERRSPTEWSKRLAETLVGAGLIPDATATAMLSEAASRGRPVAAVLADRGLVESAVSLAELARISGIPSVDISERRPVDDAFRLVPELFARELTAIGYKLEGKRLTLACAEPIDVAQQREISAFLGVEVAGCLLADPVAIENLMNTAYPQLSPDEKMATTAAAANAAPDGAQVTSSMMNAPAQVPAPAMAAAQLTHDVSSNGSPEPSYDEDDWRGDYAPDVRRATLPEASGGRPNMEPLTPTLNPDGTLDIDELLTYAVRNGASDLHLANQLPPAIRIDGSLRPIEGLARVDNEQIREMVYRILTQGLRERFEAERELDTAHTIMGVGRFRVNVFLQRGSIGAVMRAIPHEIPPFDTLGLPEIVPSLAELRRGLVLVTGPTGSGKSTTLASLVNIINQSKPLHIMTIEDPIEFLHTHSRSIVNRARGRFRHEVVSGGAPSRAAPRP